MRLVLVVLVLLSPDFARAKAIGSEISVRGQSVLVVRTEEELKAAVAANPVDYGSYFELVHLYATTKRVDEADRLLRELLKVHPNSGVVFLRLVTLHAPRDPDKALSITEEWARIEPTNVTPLILGANARLELARRVITFKGTAVEAVGHLDRGLQAIYYADALRPGDVNVVKVCAALLRAKSELVTDPEERVALLAELGTLARRQMETAQRDSALHAAPAKTYPVRAIRVGGPVRMPRKIRDVRPMLPPEAIHAKVSGVVVLEVVVGTDGFVADARILRSVPMLDDLALQAARQWEFAPSEINGTRIPVIMTATVQFTRPPQQ